MASIVILAKSKSWVAIIPNFTPTPNCIEAFNGPLNIEPETPEAFNGPITEHVLFTGELCE